jgi:hypothetical protein
MLVLSSFVLAAGLILLAFAQGIIGIAAAWAVLGGHGFGPMAESRKFEQFGS